MAAYWHSQPMNVVRSRLKLLPSRLRFFVLDFLDLEVVAAEFVVAIGSVILFAAVVKDAIRPMIPYGRSP